MTALVAGAAGWMRAWRDATVIGYLGVVVAVLVFGGCLLLIRPDRGTLDRNIEKLASRARGKVRGHPEISAADLARRRRVVEAFLAASSAGDIEAVLEVLSPEVIRRADRHAIPADRPAQVQGARTAANEIALFGARFATPLLVNSMVGIAVAPHGRLKLVLLLEFDGDKITEYELVANPTRVEQLKLAVLTPVTSVA